MAQILVTRPVQQSTALCAAIAERGDRPILFPLIDIVPEPSDSLTISLFLSRFEQMDDLVFISPTAVMMAAQFLSQHQTHYQGKHRFFAAGLATAEAIFQTPFFSTVQKSSVFYPVEDSGAEPLSQLPLLQAVLGRQIGFVKGSEGRNYLQDILRGRGAQIENFDLYQRRKREISTFESEQIANLLLQQKIDAIIITSSEILRYFVDWIKLSTGDRAKRVYRIPLVINHHRIEEMALACGFCTTFCTKAHNDAIISTLYKEVI